MMRQCLSFVFCCLWVHAAQAQLTTVPVRGGEHAQYTRLAITLPDDVTWQVTQEGGSAKLTISGGPLRFDTTQTFARIPRTRLGALESNQNELTLRLNCACPIRASEDLPSMLVLDILNEPQTIAAITDQTPRPRPRPDMLQTPTFAARAGRGLAQSLRGTAPLSATLPLTAAPVLDPVITPIWADEEIPPDTPPMPPTRAQALATLGNALASAVGQGLLTPAEDLPLQPAPPQSDEGRAVDVQQQFVVSDSVARALDRSIPFDRDEVSCPDPNVLAIQDWGPDIAATGERPTIAHVFDERDQINPEALRNLIRAQLYMGFGAEALVSLSLLSVSTPEDQILRSIAQVLDLPEAQTATFPAGLQFCGDMGALWSILAHLPAPLATDWPIDHAVRAVAMLPVHLRLHLGPSLLRHLVAQGLIGPAHRLRDILTRIAPQNGNPTLDITVAALNDISAPTETPRQTEPEQSLSSPEDVLFLLRQAGKSGSTLSQSGINSAQAHVFALRKSEIASQIGLELGRLLARDGDFDAAFRLTTNPDLDLSRDALKAMRGDVLDTLTSNASDADFLTYVFAAEPWQDPVAATTMADIVGRLRRLGFDAIADKVQAQALSANLQVQEAAELQAGLPSHNQTGFESATETEPTRAANAALLSDAIPQVVEPDAQSRMPSDNLNETSPSANATNASREQDADAGLGDAPESTTAPLSSQSVPSQGAPTPNPTAMPTDMQDIPELDRGLLSAGRDTLAQSAALRARLAEVFGQP